MAGSPGPTAPALRPIRSADLDAVHGLQRRSEGHDRIPLVTPREEFEDWLGDPHFDPDRDARLAESAGVVVAWGRVWHRPSAERLAQAFLTGTVDPAHRGCGLGRALLSWQIGRATELLRASAPRLPGFVRAMAFEHQESARRLYARFGMAAVRTSHEMLRGLVEPLAAPDPPGIAIAPWDPGRSEDARLVRNDAFLDHWGSPPVDRAAWEHLIAAHGTRLDLSFLAHEGGRVVGLCRNAVYPHDEAVTGHRAGWIHTVGVLRSHRRRGIARGLIAASLAAFRGAGLTHASLYVDAENPTGAPGLYERLGFRSVRRSILHERGV